MSTEQFCNSLQHRAAASRASLGSLKTKLLVQEEGGVHVDKFLCLLNNFVTLATSCPSFLAC